VQDAIQGPYPAAHANAPALLKIRLGAFVRMLAGVTAVLVLLHLVVTVGDLAGLSVPGMRRFYLDAEGNVPAFFSTLLLLLAAVLLGVIGRLKLAERDRFARHWLVLAVIFVALGADEALSFHEMLIDPLRIALGLGGLLRMAWVVVAIPLLCVLGLFYFDFLRALPRRSCVAFLVSASVYITGVLGFEMIGGVFYDGFLAGQGRAAYLTFMTIEETLEMVGMVLFIHSLLQYLKTFRPSIEVRIE
jgi:hypothetical protein